MISQIKIEGPAPSAGEYCAILNEEIVVKTAKTIVKNLGILVGISCLIPSLSFAATVRIGTVNMEKAMQSVELGKKAKAQIEKEISATTESLQKKKKALQARSQEFENQSLAISQSEAQKRGAALQKDIMEFQQETAKKQVDLEQRQRELFQPILNKMKHTIAEVAKKHEFSVVLEKGENPMLMAQPVLYSQPEDDITSEVITTFDKQHKATAKE